MSLRQSRSAEILPVVNGTPNLPTSRSISASKSRNQDSTPSVSPSPSPSPSPRRGLICVTGGSGFVGRHLIERLISLGYHVRSFDIYESWNDERVEFVMGDLRNKENVVAALDGCECVIHTASYTTSFASYQDLYDVNVTGTLHVIDACIANGVEQLIYTSTSSVVIDGHDIKNGDETSLKYPKTHLDNYSATKAIAERYVLAANGQPVVSRHARKSPAILCTCSLRPHAIFGPRDTHFIAKLIDHAKVGEITHMIGDGRNIVDFTYIDNVVHAHLLAMSKLKPGSVVCGQCYFITNGEPRPFWDFVNTVLTETGCMGPTKSISFYVAYFIAYCMEMWRSIMVKLFGRIRLFQSGPYTITRHMVCTMGCHNWFSHAKATRELGYKPIVSLDEGLDITIMYFQRKASARTTMHGMMRPGSRPGTRTPHALTSAGSSSDLVLPPSVLPSRGSLTAPHSLIQSQSVGGATSHSMTHPSRPLLSPYHSTHHPLTPHSSAGALLRDIPTQPHHAMNIVRSQSSKTPREGHLHSPVHDHHHTTHDHVG